MREHMLKKILKVCVVVVLALACLAGVAVQFQPAQASGLCCDSCTEQLLECQANCPEGDFQCRLACKSAWVQCVGICC